MRCSKVGMTYWQISSVSLKLFTARWLFRLMKPLFAVICGHDVQNDYIARECPWHKRFHYIIVIIITIDVEPPPTRQYTLCTLRSSGVALFKQVDRRTAFVKSLPRLYYNITFEKVNASKFSTSYMSYYFVGLSLYLKHGVRRDCVKNVYLLFFKRDYRFFPE